MPSFKSILTMVVVVVIAMAIINRVPQLKAITG